MRKCKRRKRNKTEQSFLPRGFSSLDFGQLTTTEWWWAFQAEGDDYDYANDNEPRTLTQSGDDDGTDEQTRQKILVASLSSVVAESSESESESESNKNGSKLHQWPGSSITRAPLDWGWYGMSHIIGKPYRNGGGGASAVIVGFFEFCRWTTKHPIS